MKGLELARRYFFAHGAPLLERCFPDCSGRIAAGLVGEGSECFGFDDEISRDHDFGPAFCLWLRAEDHREIGAALSEALATLPTEFEGVRPSAASEWARGRRGVLEVGAFYAGLIGLARAPRSLQEWRAIPESRLAACTNGEVFCDPCGEFSRVRAQLLAFYPEDVRRKKIASRCMSAAQAGQYNLPRSLRRGELVAARLAEAQFLAHALSLVFLLNRRYAPFSKWMHRASRDLPVLGASAHALAGAIVQALGTRRKLAAVEALCAEIVGELRRQGLSDSTSAFLADHGPMAQRGIEDPELRASDVRAE